MIILGSDTAESGMETAAKALRNGESALDAVEAGIRVVETAAQVYSVGQDAWPNLLGQSELDASIMDGRTLEAGAVGALRGFTHPISVARRVMQDIADVLLFGEGAARFADEIQAERGELMGEAVRRGWAEWLRERVPCRNLVNWPAQQLTPWARSSADPETIHGTVCMLARDQSGNTAVGVSTSGWSWKYPGRLGDSPIIGAGNYVDDRFGAAACTGFGEMTIRAGTARSVVLYIRMGFSIKEAVCAAAADLRAALWRYGGAVTIYAFDREEQHHVTTYSLSDQGSNYWVWKEGMLEARREIGDTLAATVSETED